MRSIELFAGSWLLFAACTQPVETVATGERALGTFSGAELRAVPQEIQPETDAPPSYDVVAVERGTRRVIASGVRDARIAGGVLYTVETSGALIRATRERRDLIADRVSGAPALLPSGLLIVSRTEDEPGETDLWSIDADGALVRVAAAPGPDDLPIALPDGSVLFVSGRSSVASWWRFDPSTGRTVQLTNVGLEAGGSREGFVPVAAEAAEVVNGRVRYDAGGGELWELDPATGAAQRVEARR